MLSDMGHGGSSVGEAHLTELAGEEGGQVDPHCVVSQVEDVAGSVFTFSTRPSSNFSPFLFFLFSPLFPHQKVRVVELHVTEHGDEGVRLQVTLGADVARVGLGFILRVFSTEMTVDLLLPRRSILTEMTLVPAPHMNSSDVNPASGGYQTDFRVMTSNLIIFRASEALHLFSYDRPQNSQDTGPFPIGVLLLFPERPERVNLNSGWTAAMCLWYCSSSPDHISSHNANHSQSFTSVGAYSTLQDGLLFEVLLRPPVLPAQVVLHPVPLLRAPLAEGAVKPQLDVVHLRVDLSR